MHHCSPRPTPSPRVVARLVTEVFTVASRAVHPPHPGRSESLRTVAGMDPTSALSARQRVIVIALAGLVLALVSLRPTPELVPKPGAASPPPVLAEEPSLAESAEGH